MKKHKKRLVIAGAIVLVLAGGLFYRYQGRYACTSVETYDVVRDDCYFECDSDEQCDRLTKQRDAELDQALAAAKTKAATGSETNGTTYQVTSDGLQPRPPADQLALWELTRSIIGNDRALASLETFEVFNDANNDTGASVWRSEKSPDKWHMNINQAYADDKKDLVRTIVHEYGHIVSLSIDQVAEVSGSCPRLELSEGCSKQNSYINSYYDRFWKDYDFDARQASELSEKDAADLYASEPESFVSEYASSNITEDVAESFADFVTKAKPGGNAVKDQKVRFFYSYQQLVSLRDSMRAASAKELL